MGRIGGCHDGRFFNETRNIRISGVISTTVAAQVPVAEQMSRFGFNLAREGLEVGVSPYRTRWHFWLTAAGFELNNEPALWRFHIV